MFSMFWMIFWYENEHDNQNIVENIDIRCSNHRKETGLSMKNMNANYKGITPSIVLNTVLHHVGMSWKM